MVFHIRHVLECNERNPDLRGDLMKLCSMGGLLGMYSKSHNIPHRLGM